MKKKKKILFVNGHLNVGGIEKSLVDLLNNLDYSFLEIDLLLLEDLGDYLHHIPPQVNIIYKNINNVYGPFTKTIITNLLHFRFSDIIFRFIIALSPYIGKNIYRHLRPLLNIRHSYDCAIAYRLGFCTEIVSLAVNSKKKICWWHNGECNYNNAQIKHINYLWRNIDYIVTVSKGCKEMITRAFSVSPNKITIIPNIININNLNKLSATKNPYPIKDNPKYNFITIGRLCWEKHIEDIPLIAQGLLKGGISNFKWYIIGDGEKKDEICNLITNLKLNKHVILIGKKENPYPYIKYADFLIHTSHIEAQCITLLEAMALKTPCIATRTNIPQDFVFHNINCILTEQNVNNQISTIIKTLTTMPDTEYITNNAYNYVKRNYHYQLITTEFYKIIQ